jgi:DNA-binding Lrp family transcriptional regulator
MAIFDACYGELVEIDQIDRGIVHALAVDGRASFSEIAGVLGVSDQTVARRYRRLRSSGVIRVVGLRARQSMGSLGWLLHLRCVPGVGESLAEGLAQRSDTAWVQLLSGDTEVLCTVRGAAAERDAVVAKLPRGGRIVAVSAHQLLHVYVAASGGLGFLRALEQDQLKPLRPPVPEDVAGRGGGRGRGELAELGEMDLAIFRELGVDGRRSHADLAKAIGWSESSVRRRMEQLTESGTLFYDLELDMAAFGYHAPTWLWLSVRPSELAATGEAFAGFPEVAYAAATTGASNLLVCAVCRDEEEFYDFLTTKVGSLRAVDRVETSPIIRTLKQSSPYAIIGLRAGLRHRRGDQRGVDQRAIGRRVEEQPGGLVERGDRLIPGGRHRRRARNLRAHQWYDGGHDGRRQRRKVVADQRGQLGVRRGVKQVLGLGDGGDERLDGRLLAG